MRRAIGFGALGVLLSFHAGATSTICKIGDSNGLNPTAISWDTETRKAKVSDPQKGELEGKLTLSRSGGSWGTAVNLRFVDPHPLFDDELEFYVFPMLLQSQGYRVIGVGYEVFGIERYLRGLIANSLPASCSSL